MGITASKCTVIADSAGNAHRARILTKLAFFTQRVIACRKYGRCCDLARWDNVSRIPLPVSKPLGVLPITCKPQTTPSVPLWAPTSPFLLIFFHDLIQHSKTVCNARDVTYMAPSHNLLMISSNVNFGALISRNQSAQLQILTENQREQ